MTGRQNKAIAALLTAPTTQAAAAQAGVGYATLRRWLTQDAAFRREYDSAMAQLIQEAATQARQGMGEAVQTLREIATDQDSPGAVRVQAARAIIDSGVKLIEVSDILARLEALENADDWR